MTDHFESPRLLLDRAKEHTRNLEAEINAFVNRHPYTHVVEFEPDRGQYAYKWRMTENPPNRCRAIAFDIGNALRSALDQIVYAACISLSVSPLKSYKFPFGDTPADVENDIARGCKHVPQEILAIARALKPYQGGNDLLWGLNKMRNSKDHKVLAPVGFIPGGVSIKGGPIELRGASFGMADWNPLKNEMTYALSGEIGGIKGQYNCQFAVFVAISDVPILSGHPAVAVFDKLCSEVEHVLLAVEAETVRLMNRLANP